MNERTDADRARQRGFYWVKVHPDDDPEVAEWQNDYDDGHWYFTGCELCGESSELIWIDERQILWPGREP